MYWGTSRWTPVEIMEAYTNCRQFNCVTPIVEQAEYHLFYRDKPELYMPELYNKIGTMFIPNFIIFRILRKSFSHFNFCKFCKMLCINQYFLVTF